jgi:hypothetical protein
MSKEYKDWYDQIIWYKDYVVLLGGKRISKLPYVTKGEFDTDNFNKLLKNAFIFENKC